MELLINSILWVLLRNLSLRFSTVFVGDAQRTSGVCDLHGGNAGLATLITGGTINGMQIEFDSMKRDRTLFERGLDFAHAAQLFAGLHFTSQDLRVDYAEDRFITVGFLRADLVVMVWTPRGEVRRIISTRKANEREKTFYAQHLG